MTISHSASCSIWYRRAVDGGSDRSDQYIAKYNRGYRYLLTMVDVFSKHAWVEPVKSKTGQAVTEAFEKILRKGGRNP